MLSEYVRFVAYIPGVCDRLVSAFPVVTTLAPQPLCDAGVHGTIKDVNWAFQAKYAVP